MTSPFQLSAPSRGLQVHELLLFEAAEHVESREFAAANLTRLGAQVGVKNGGFQ